MYPYKAIKINGKKIDQHRLIAETKAGKKLGFDTVVHHEDENPRNNADDNLKVMSRSKHAILHNTGRKLSQSTKDAMRVAHQEIRTGAKLSVTQVESIVTGLKTGLSAYQLADLYNVTPKTIYNIKNGKKWGWLFKNKKPLAAETTNG